MKNKYLLSKMGSYLWPLFVLGCISVSLFMFIEWRWQTHVQKHIPLLDNVSQAKAYEIEAQFLLERLIAGDKSIRIEDVWPLFDRAEMAVRDAINGRSNINNITGKVIQGQTLKEKLLQLKSDLAYLHEMAREKWSKREGYRANSVEERAAFYRFKKDFESFEIMLINNISNTVTEQERIHVLALTFLFFIGLVSLIIVFRAGMKREKAEEDLKHVNEELENSVLERTVELKESEEKYHQLFDNESDAILVFDAETLQVEDVNKATLALFGYSKEEFLDLKLTDISAEKDKTIKTARRLSEKVNGSHNVPERHLVRKDGTILIGEISAGNFINKGRNKLIGAIRDITERKKAEEALQESEQKYRLLFENLTVGFALHEMIYDEKGHPADYRFIEINPAFEKLTGVKASDLVGKTVKEVLPNTEQYWIDVSGKVAQTGEPVSYQNYSREMGRYYDTWLFSPARDKFAVVFSDITERKKAEEELRHAKEEIEVWNRELEKRVKEKSDELEKSQAQLIQQEKLAAMGEMASGLAHELNSPLAGVLPMIEQYKNEAEAGSRRYKELSMILKACEHMAKILRDFSSFSRESKGIFHSLDLNEVIEDTLSFYGSRIKQKSIQLIKEYDDTLPEIVGDKTGLQQVTLNMCANAIDAMMDGGKLILKTGISRDKNNVIMEVSDDGTGIDKKNLGKIFDPFYTTKRPGRGVGLGLSVSYKIIEKHKGKMSVESEPGKGTKFTIYLPTVKQIKEQGKK